MLKKKIPFLILLFFINILFSKDYEILDKIIVTVEKDVITQGEVDLELKKLSDSRIDNISKIEKEKLLKNILDSLIKKKLILQYATINEILPSNQDIEITLRNILLNNKITQEELEKSLLDQNTNIYEFKEDLLYQLTIKQIKEKIITPYINISEYEVDAWLKNQDNSNTEYKISHILIKNSNTYKDIAIEEIKNVKNIEEFSKLAKKYSNGPNASEGGTLDWKKSDELPDIFLEFIKEAKVGDISKIIESPNGYHFLFYESSRNEIKKNTILIKQYKFQQIVLKLNAITQNDEIKSKLLNIKNLIDNGLSFDEAVKMYSDEQTNSDSKKLDWITYNNLLPEFRQFLDQFPAKKIIGPFKTEIGWHLVKVYDFRESDFTDEAKRQEAKIKLALKKSETRFADWVDVLIKNSKIKYINDN